MCSKTWTTSLYFATANYSRLASTAERAGWWHGNVTEALANRGLAVNTVVNMTSRAGSVVTDITSVSDGFVAAVFELLLSGQLVVAGNSAVLCSGRGFVAFPEAQDPRQAIICTPYKTCNSYEYILSPGDATSDRVCALVTSCDNDEYEVQPPTPTSNRVCGALSTGGSSGVSAGTSIIVALLVVLVLTLIIAVVVWRRRKVLKDRRQQEMMSKFSSQLTNDTSNDIVTVGEGKTGQEPAGG